MIRNFFADLEIDSSAELEEVKLAYRRLARRFHPDLNPGDIYAEESFKKIKEAYDYLSDEQRLQKHRTEIQAQSSSQTLTYDRWARQSPISNISSIYEDLTSPLTASVDEELDIHLIFEIHKDAAEKKKARIELQRKDQCKSCQGTGGSNKSVQMTCKKCAGLRYVLISRGAFRWKKTCDECSGKGYRVLSACPACDGYGKLTDTKSLDLALPDTVESGNAIQYAGQGHEAFDGKSRGDLWVTWKIKK